MLDENGNQLGSGVIYETEVFGSYLDVTRIDYDIAQKMLSQEFWRLRGKTFRLICNKTFSKAFAILFKRS